MSKEAFVQCSCGFNVRALLRPSLPTPPKRPWRAVGGRGSREPQGRPEEGTETNYAKRMPCDLPLAAVSPHGHPAAAPEGPRRLRKVPARPQECPKKAHNLVKFWRPRGPLAAQFAATELPWAPGPMTHDGVDDVPVVLAGRILRKRPAGSDGRSGAGRDASGWGGQRLSVAPRPNTHPTCGKVARL